MRFQSKTEQEVAAGNLLQPGDYPFEVLEAEDRVSKAGNDMIYLKLGIDTDDGKRVVFDYLLEAIEHKLRHFFDTIGMLETYETGQATSEDVLGATGMAKIVIQPEKDGFDAKNVVKDYIKRAPTSKQTAPKKAVKNAKTIQAKDMIDDEIPGFD